MNTILSESVVKAQKNHCCDMCRGMIKAGEKYCRTFSVDGGDNWMLKEHLECKEKREAMKENKRLRKELKNTNKAVALQFEVERLQAVRNIKLQKRVEELEEFVRIVGEGDCALPDLTERCYCITCSARKLTPSSEEVCK